MGPNFAIASFALKSPLRSRGSCRESNAKMSEPKTPWVRLREQMNEEEIAQLTEGRVASNPSELTRDIRAAIRNIYGYFKGRKDAKDWGRKIK